MTAARYHLSPSRAALFWSAIVAVLGSLLLAAPAFAVDLETAKAQGLIGEQRNGYVGAVNANPSPAIQALVADVNAKRRASYSDVAQQTQGANLAAVEQLAGQKLIEMTPPGQYVQSAGGQWVRKP